MAVRLRPIGDDELPGFMASARESYERQLIEFGHRTPDEAHAKAEADSVRLLSCAGGPPDLHVFAVEDAATGAPVGTAFFASLDAHGRSVAFIYGLEIDAEHRGRGLGRAAMIAVEQKARELGHEEIRLNVFGGNAPARALYRSLGYEEADVTMIKPLT
jgi:GNAT superfamily N-acetyltransferase